HQHTLHLATSYDRYRRTPARQRQAFLQEMVALGGRPPVSVTAQEALPRLLPLVRHRLALEISHLSADPNATLPSLIPHRLAAGHIAIGVACDLPDHVLWVMEEQLRHWGLTAGEAARRAEENLRLKTGRALEPAGPGLYVSPWRDGYDAARFILTDL